MGRLNTDMNVRGEVIGTPYNGAEQYIAKDGHTFSFRQYMEFYYKF